MRGYLILMALFGQLATGLSDMGTHFPCPDCPSGIGPTPVPITAQFQELEHCSVTSAPVSTGYACDEDKVTFVSTRIPAAATDGTYTTTLVTEIDQIITVSYSRATASRSWAHRDGLPVPTSAVVVEVVEYIYTVPFYQLGRHALPGYEGCGLCPVDICGPNDLREEFQPVHVKECHNGNCVVYDAVRDCSPQYATTAKIINGQSRVYTKGISGYKTHFHRPDVTPLPAFPSAPVGCHVIRAGYVTVVHEHLVTMSAVYTVPSVGGYYGELIEVPGGYRAPCPTCQPRPIGTCDTCVPPPGWTVIVTVINNPSPSTVTLTVPTTVPTAVLATIDGGSIVTITADDPTVATDPNNPNTDDSGNPIIPTLTTGGSAATDPVVQPTAAALRCPASDGIVFLTGAESTFQVQCSSGFSGVEINAKRDQTNARSDLFSRDLGMTGSFESCIELCDNTETCVAAVFYPASGRCRGFSSVDGSTVDDGAWAATLIAKGPGFGTTSSPAPATSTSASSTQSTAEPSSDPDPDTEDASVERRAQLVPKRTLSKKNVDQSGVKRRAGRISNANLDKAEKKSKRSINIQL